MANRILWSPDGTLFGKHVQFLRLAPLSLMMIMTIVNKNNNNDNIVFCIVVIKEWTYC